MAIIFIRTIIIFVSILVSMRIMGKRQLGEIELSELVIAVLISNLAANPLQDIGMPLLNGLIPILILFCCELIISGIMARSVRFRVLICGRPCVLIDNGKINQRELRKNRFTLDELAEELRNQSVTDISTVKYAILETDGVLNVILFPGQSPVTPDQLSIQVEDPGYPSIIVNDGKIIEKNLKRMGKDLKWLKKELDRRGLKDAESVYLMTINNLDQVYFAAKEADAKW